MATVCGLPGSGSSLRAPSGKPYAAPRPPPRLLLVHCSVEKRTCSYDYGSSTKKSETLLVACLLFGQLPLLPQLLLQIRCVFSNAVLDRVNFEKANLQAAVFKNTLLSASTFNDAQLKDAVFEDTIISYIDLQKLCAKTTITEEGRAELGCL